MRWTLAQTGNTNVRSVNALVGETNDSGLNDIRALAVRPDHVVEAIGAARGGAVAEGSVGAGTGTQAFGWKGGIGTSSRRLTAALGGYTVGVLVQSNYGGVLTMGGAPVGRELGRYAYAPNPRGNEAGDGSCMIVVATDAPLDARDLKRLAARAVFGLARVVRGRRRRQIGAAVDVAAAPAHRRRVAGRDARRCRPRQRPRPARRGSAPCRTRGWRSAGRIGAAAATGVHRGP